MITGPDRKLRGVGSGNASELTRLKALPEVQRREIYAWRSEWPTLTNSQIRARIKERLGIDLHSDSQLCGFWRWQAGQMQSQELAPLIVEAAFNEFAAVLTPYPELEKEYQRLRAKLMALVSWGEAS